MGQFGVWADLIPTSLSLTMTDTLSKRDEACRQNRQTGQSFWVQLDINAPMPMRWGKNLFGIEKMSSWQPGKVVKA